MLRPSPAAAPGILAVHLAMLGGCINPTGKDGAGSDGIVLIQAAGDCDAHAWYWSCGVEKVSHPVAQKSPNARGLYDMSGNLWELCHDWHGSDYYSRSPETDPFGLSQGSERVVRGGSWLGDSTSLRSSCRTSYNPGSTQHTYGFRVVLRLREQGCRRH